MMKYKQHWEVIHWPQGGRLQLCETKEVAERLAVTDIKNRNKNDNRKKRIRVAERMGRKNQDRKQLSGNRTHRKLYQTSREKKSGVKGGAEKNVK